MGDLIRNAADLPVVIIGATTTGVATTPVSSDASGDLNVILPDGTQQVAVTANFTTAGNNLILQTNGASQCSFQAGGTWSGLIAAYVSSDGSNFFDVPLFSWFDFSKQTYSGDSNLYSFECGGFKEIKIDAVTLTSGTANLTAWLNVGQGPGIVTSPNAASFLTTSTLAAGTANIGHIDGEGTSGSPSGGILTVQGYGNNGVLPVSNLDVGPATQTITAQDGGSSTTSGAGNQSFITGTPTTGSVATFALSGIDSVEVQGISNSFVGQVRTEISMDGGTTWTPRNIQQDNISAIATLFASFSGVINTAACSHLRVRCFSFVSGSMVITVRESINPAYIFVQPGNIPNINPWLVTGTSTGTLTNNNAAPAANNVGVLGHIAEGTINASRYTTGDQVLAVTDLAGNSNVDLQYYLGTAISKTNPIATTITDGTNTLTAAISAYGVAPTGTEVMGVNAYITNTPGMVAQASTTSGQVGDLMMGAVTTAAPSYSNAQTSPLSLTTAGELRVTLSSAEEPNGNSPIPGSAVFIGGTDGVNFRGISTTNTGIQIVQGAPITSGSRSTVGFTVEDIINTGRNVSNFFMTTPIVTTSSDTLMSLTGYKSGAAVGATTTPAVVSAGKIYRITSIQFTYVAITTAGTATFTLRANTGGVVAIGSPAVQNWTIGAPAATAGITNTVTYDIPDGMEFAAGTGIGISMIGRGATQTAAAVGYGLCTIYGFEY